MRRRDDIVMRPRLEGAQRPTNAKGRQKEARQIQLLTRDDGATGSIRNKLLVARAYRRIARKRRERQRLKRLAKVGARFSRAFAKAGISVATRNPLGLILAAVATATAIFTKAVTGRSYAQMNQGVWSKLIGDLDLQSAAASEARRTVASNSFLARIAANGGWQSVSLAIDTEREENLRFLRGRRMIEQQFTVNSYWDNLTDRGYRRVKRVIIKAFGEDSMVVDAARRFVRSYRDSYKSNWQSNR